MARFVWVTIDAAPEGGVYVNPDHVSQIDDEGSRADLWMRDMEHPIRVNMTAAEVVELLSD